MVNEQTSYLCEILRDIKSINSKSPEQEEKIKNIEEIFKDYILTHSKLREQLLSQSQKNIKNS